MEQLMKETMESEKALLDQYKKELADLENQRGLAKVMSKKEIYEAKISLRSVIADLEKSVASYQ